MAAPRLQALATATSGQRFWSVVGSSHMSQQERDSWRCLTLARLAIDQGPRTHTPRALPRIMNCSHVHPLPSRRSLSKDPSPQRELLPVRRTYAGAQYISYARAIHIRTRHSASSTLILQPCVRSSHAPVCQACCGSPYVQTACTLAVPYHKPFS